MRQDEAIDYFVAQLSKIEGVLAIFLKGSLARGTGDAWSDVDLYCLMGPQHFENFMQAREAIVRNFRPVILFEEVNFGKPQLIAIYDNHLHLDLYGTTEVPDVTLEPIKPLYDPGLVLPKNTSTRRSFEKLDAEVADHLNEVIYTFHELDIAIKRGDFIWAQRLGSHILAGLCLALCNQYHTDLPILHIKNLTGHLPQAMGDRILLASKLLGQGEYPQALKLLLAICHEVVANQDTRVKSGLRLQFLKAFTEEFG